MKRRWPRRYQDLLPWSSAIENLEQLLLDALELPKALDKLQSSWVGPVGTREKADKELRKFQEPFMFFELFAEMRGPVPSYLQDLLAIEKKAVLETFCRKIEITQRDLCQLIFNADRIGYAHEIHHHEVRPKHLEPTDEEIASTDRQKFFRKISQIFKERRLFVAHAFYNASRWHVFYFDQRNRSPGRDNHWKGGAHIHFLNHLWPEYTLQTFWDSANEQNPKFRGALHIRYKPNDKPPARPFP